MRQVNICRVPVLSTQVKPLESARNLDIIIDSELSLSAHVAVILATINSDSCAQRFGH